MQPKTRFITNGITVTSEFDVDLVQGMPAINFDGASHSLYCNRSEVVIDGRRFIKLIEGDEGTIVEINFSEFTTRFHEDVQLEEVTISPAGHSIIIYAYLMDDEGYFFIDSVIIEEEK